MSLKNFVKENLVLVLGLTLPALLIVFFFLATVIPKSIGTPPQYEMLFTAAMRYEYQNPPDYLVDFVVKDNHLLVRAKRNEEKNRNYNSKKLMAYDGKTESVREITLDMAKIGETATNGEAVLEETKNMTIDPSSTSPDGYMLDGPNYGGGGLVGGLFGGGYRSSGYRIKKGGSGYKLPNTQRDSYYNQVQFIGWVVKK